MAVSAGLIAQGFPAVEALLIEFVEDFFLVWFEQGVDLRGVGFERIADLVLGVFAECEDVVCEGFVVLADGGFLGGG